MPAPHKDTTVNGVEYRIGMLTAADGSAIVAMFGERYAARKAKEVEKRRAAGLPDEPSEDPQANDVGADVRAMMMANFLMTQLDRKETKEVFAMCSEVICCYEDHQGQRVPMPILIDGRYQPAELEYDPALVDLVRETLALRIAPFFSGSASSK